MTKARTTDLHQRSKGRLLLLAIFLLVLYFIVPRLGGFSESVDAIKDARFEFVLLALIPLAGTYILAAAMYQCLAVHRLWYRRTLLTQIANGFANRLLPAGLGGLTLSVQYLKKAGHTLPEALAVAGLNNTLGFIGHMTLLIGIVLFGGDRLLDDLQLPHVRYGGWILAGLAVVIVVNLLVFQRLRKYVYVLTADTIRTVLLAFRKRPSQVAFAFLLSIGLTVAYVLTFYLCTLAVGIALPPGSIFAVFTVGMIATTATPTPGGLGGAEAGLVAGLLAYGVEAPAALAAVLLYRLLSYWLPLLPGIAVFMHIRKKYL